MNEEFSKSMWNELCEDAECTDTRYHATVEELVQRIKDSTRDISLLRSTEAIIEDAYSRWLREQH